MNIQGQQTFNAADRSVAATIADLNIRRTSSVCHHHDYYDHHCKDYHGNYHKYECKDYDNEYS